MNTVENNNLFTHDRLDMRKDSAEIISVPAR